MAEKRAPKKGKTGHTPGPWNVVVPMHPLSGGFTHAINSPVGAVGWAFPVGDDLGLAAANARLMAAAPELLAALEGMMEWQRGIHELLPDALFEQVRTAIKKVKGGSS